MAEYFDEVVLDTEDLEKLFQAATEYVRTMKNLSDEKKLTFYALYKQASVLNALCNVRLSLCTSLYSNLSQPVRYRRIVVLMSLKTNPFTLLNLGTLE